MGDGEHRDERSDEQLWAAFVAGQDEALPALERRYRRELYWYLLLSTGKQDAAARALRSTWALLAGWRGAFAGFGSFRTWLYAVATQNTTPATRPETFGLTDLLDDLKRTERTTERARLFFRVVDIDRALRQPFLLATLAGLSVEDAALVCNFSVERTRHCLARAYRTMARLRRREAAGTP
ncbi:MAG: hypothetical protein GXY85_12530 [Candidatus Brocadiaceae bacterium]|nr:hypothetical protein [Candidatus Brocadiaceae bacterium]